MRRLVIILAAVLLTAGGPLATPGTAAGGFAVTYLDPLPDTLVPGTSYTVGFWVLQHGTHPFPGDLGPTGLRLTDADGRATVYAGAALPEAGHYAAAVHVSGGTYRVDGIQGLFEPYAVGTLTVPGGLSLNPLQPGLARALDDPQTHWGAIRPPGFPPGATKASGSQQGAAEQGGGEPGSGKPGSGEAGAGEAGGDAAGMAAAGPSSAARPSGAPASAGRAGPGADGVPVGDGFPPYALVIAAVGGAVLALAAVRRPRGRREPDPPVDDRADTITIGG